TEGITIIEKQILVAPPILLNEAGKTNFLAWTTGKVSLRVIGIAEGKAMGFGLVVVQASQPLRAVMGGGKHGRPSSELHRSAVDAGLGVNSEGHRKWRARTAQIAQRTEV